MYYQVCRPTRYHRSATVQPWCNGATHTCNVRSRSLVPSPVLRSPDFGTKYHIRRSFAAMSERAWRVFQDSAWFCLVRKPKISDSHPSRIILQSLFLIAWLCPIRVREGKPPTVKGVEINSRRYLHIARPISLHLRCIVR